MTGTFVPASMARGRFAVILAAMWLATIGADILLQGGLLARFYVESHPFLLPRRRAFQLIPLGYAAFLILEGFVLWLRRGLLFLGYLGASISFLMYLVEFLVEFRYSNRSLYDRFSGAAMIPLFAALLVAITAKGPGRVLLVLASLVVFGLWLSITPLRLF